MADITYTITLRDSGIRAFTMPEGYWDDVQIYCWGAGGGNEPGGSRGGGGGYAQSTVYINPGDEVVLQIGQPGRNGSGMTGGAGGIDPTFRTFQGGSSADARDEDNDTGPGGGGGGASWVAVNGTFVCVGAGGGGAGGFGDDVAPGTPGLPGGVTTNGLSSNTRGGSASAGWTTGGGGGAGYPKGGAAGASYGDDADDAPAGSGGQNFGNVTIAGTGITPGGKNVSYYPGLHIGEQGYPGYIAIVLRKKLNLFLKDSGSWANVAAAYTKIDSDWKQIQSAWVKVSNAWKPIITNKTVNLYNWPTRRIKANIIISSDTSSYDLFSNIPVVYWDGLMDIDVWVLPGVAITDTNNTSAFTISGFTTNDNVTLHNYGTIQGLGGIGGGGGYVYTSTTTKNSGGGKSSSGGKGGGVIITTNNTSAPSAGTAGGVGLTITSPTILLNYGNIGGGGGGGGGGAATGSQGGGGAGYGPGANAGTLTAGGAGGTSGNDGGAGGSRGQAGSPGQSGAVGGAPGYALVGNTYLRTESVRGTFYGPVV